MKKNLPELRFQNSKTSWNTKPLREVASLTSGVHLAPHEYSHSGLVPYFTGPSDITDDLQSVTKFTDKDTKIATYGEVFITVKGSGVGKTSICKVPKAFMGRQLMSLNASSASNNLIKAILDNNYHRLEALAMGNMIPGLSREDILSLKVSLPASEQEQQKIADFLTSVDSKISQLTEKHRLLKEYKKGVMQQIFSQQIRFKDEDGETFPDWKNNKLGDISTKVGSGSTPKGGADAYVNEGIKFIRSQNVNNDKLDLSDIVYISTDTHLKMKGSTVKPLDILLNITGASIGRSCVVPSTFNEGNVNQHVCIIRPNNELSSHYLHRYLSSYGGQKNIFQSQAGGGREGLNFQSIRSFNIPLPCLKEQRKIAQFLLSIDKKINVVAEQIEQTKQFKKGLLQQMFV